MTRLTETRRSARQLRKKRLIIALLNSIDFEIILFVSILLYFTVLILLITNEVGDIGRVYLETATGLIIAISSSFAGYKTTAKQPSESEEVYNPDTEEYYDEQF